MADTYDLETGRHTRSIPERKDPNRNMLQKAASKGKLFGGFGKKLNQRRIDIENLMNQ